MTNTCCFRGQNNCTVATGDFSFRQSPFSVRSMTKHPLPPWTAPGFLRGFLKAAAKGQRPPTRIKRLKGDKVHWHISKKGFPKRSTTNTDQPLPGLAWLASLFKEIGKQIFIVRDRTEAGGEVLKSGDNSQNPGLWCRRKLVLCIYNLYFFCYCC